MHANKKILGVITARGGSKSIHRKNIKKLAGKPLIVYTIEAAKESKYLTRVIVSTDDKEIAEISEHHGADVPFMRPTELAQDDSTSMEAVQHALGWLKENENEEYDYIMILQPTSPLRTAEDIDNAIKKIVETHADSVMSMYELTDFSPKKIKKITQEGVIEPYFQEEGQQSVRRQDLNKMYKRNCAIYLTRTDLIMEGDLFGKKSVAYFMPEDRSIDINQPSDFEMVECFLKKKIFADAH